MHYVLLKACHVWLSFQIVVLGFNDHAYLRAELRVSFHYLHFAIFSYFAFTLKKILCVFLHVYLRDR